MQYLDPDSDMHWIVFKELVGSGSAKLPPAIWIANPSQMKIHTSNIVFVDPPWIPCVFGSGIFWSIRTGIQVFMTKNCKNHIFGSKNKNFLSPGLHEGRLSFRRTGEVLSPQKRIFCTWNMKILHFFLLLWLIFALLDPDPADQNQSGSIRFRIQNTVFKANNFILREKFVSAGSLPDSSMVLCGITTRCATPSRSSSSLSSTPWNLLKERWNRPEFFISSAYLTENGKELLL